MSRCNNGFKRLGLPCATLESMSNDSLHEAFMTADLGSDYEITSFMNELKTIINGNDMSYDKVHYYYFHNLLNHVSLNDAHVLAIKGKLPSRLLSMKTTPPYRPTCLSRPIENLGDLKERQGI